MRLSPVGVLVVELDMLRHEPSHELDRPPAVLGAADIAPVTPVEIGEIECRHRVIPVGEPKIHVGAVIGRDLGLVDDELRTRDIALARGERELHWREQDCADK